MKKLLLLACSLCLVLFAKAQTTVTTTAGNLRADLIAAVGGESNLGTITQLKINGTLNAQDFIDLKSGIANMRINKATLISIDLSGVTDIENKELPTDAFYQFTGLLTFKLPVGGAITTIGQSAFGGCTQLTAIDIPEGVTTIGYAAFSGASQVATLKLPSTLKIIGESAFRTFTSLTQLTLPEGLNSIGSGAFYGMNNAKNATITEIVIPSTVEYIGKEAFALGLYVKKVTFASPRNGRPLKVGGGAFRSNFYYNTATELVTFEFPENTTVFFLEAGQDDGVFNQMFRASTGLKEIKNFPSGVTKIDNYAFSGTAIESFAVPEGVTLVGASAFRDARSLKSIVLPNSVTTIGNFAFAGTSALTSIKLGNSVQSIGTSAFSGASAVETLELPATVTAIAENAFSGMSGLKSLIVNNPEPIIFSTQRNVFKDINKETCVLYVPRGTVNDYKDFDLWNTFTTIREIGSDAREQQIENFEDISAKAGDVIELNATATSSLPLTYTVADETIARLEGNRLTVLKEGETTITATQVGNNDFMAAEKTVKLVVANYDWLEEVTISAVGNVAKVVGPIEAVARFTKFYVNDAESPLINGQADLTGQAGELRLKATTPDGAEVIRLKINRQ